MDDLTILDLPGFDSASLDPSRRVARRLRRQLLGRAFVDLTITVANCLKVSGPTATYRAGTTLTAGEPVYISDTTTTPNTVLACLNDTAAHALVAGITLAAALLGQPVVCALPGCVITIGATVVVGTMYVISANAGKIAVDSDLGAGVYCTNVGRAITTGNIQFDGTAFGVAHG